MSIRLVNIHGLIEQVGLRREHRKRNELDTLDTVFLGLSADVDSLVPADGTQHPVYQLMTSTGYQITNREATLCDLHVSYVGKLKGNGNAVVITAPEINQSRHLGSVSYTTSVAQSTVTITTAAYTERYTVLTTTGYTVRFTALGVTFKYLTNRAPPGRFTGNFVSQAQSYLGTANIATFRTSFNAQTDIPATGYVQATLVFENDLVSVDVQDLCNGWFNVSEQYLTQALVNTQVIGALGDSPSNRI